MKKNDNFFLKNKPKFIIGAVSKEQFPKNFIPEVAFVGRSNVGKSSLINAITNSQISRISKTPGRTKELNFFNIANKINFVDMPGYGFARTTEDERRKLHNMIYDYLFLNKNLKILFLLIDSRRGIGTYDLDFMEILDELSVSYQIVLTKTDKVNHIEVVKLVDSIKVESTNHSTMNLDVLTVSRKKGYGIIEMRDIIYCLFN